MKRSDDEVTNQSATSDNPGVDESSPTDRGRSIAASIKARASGLPALLADGLDAGAEVLRSPRPRGSKTAPGTAVAVNRDPVIDDIADTLASGMKSSADWIRDADLDKLKHGVAKQVKEHPARTLLVALGAGFLLGKALRR